MKRKRKVYFITLKVNMKGLKFFHPKPSKNQTNETSEQDFLFLLAFLVRVGWSIVYFSFVCVWDGNTNDGESGDSISKERALRHFYKTQKNIKEKLKRMELREWRSKI